jgi:hypothetical protein
MATQAQILLDVETVHLAERRADELGLSVAQYITEVLSRDLRSEPTEGRVDPSVVFDLGSSTKPTNIARDKDRMVGAAVLAEAQSEQPP